MKSYAKHNKREKSRGSRISTHTYFTRLQQAFKLKFAPLFAPLTNLQNKIKKIIILYGINIYYSYMLYRFYVPNNIKRNVSPTNGIM